jgi:hypothetical protein
MSDLFFACFFRHGPEGMKKPIRTRRLRIPTVIRQNSEPFRRHLQTREFCEKDWVEELPRKPERLVTIEDAAELQLQQENVVRLETRPPNVEGKGAVRQRNLLINCLRMRPDRIIVGEVRGDEAFDMLQAMNTGHEGSMTTVHANTCRDALSRLESMVAMSNLNLPDNLDTASLQVRQVITDLTGPDEGGTTATATIRESLSNMNVAAANMADGTEALKHNFLLRSFFRSRGYYSLASIFARSLSQGSPIGFSSAQSLWKAIATATNSMIALRLHVNGRFWSAIIFRAILASIPTGWGR